MLGGVNILDFCNASAVIMLFFVVQRPKSMILMPRTRVGTPPDYIHMYKQVEIRTNTYINSIDYEFWTPLDVSGRLGTSLDASGRLCMPLSNPLCFCVQMASFGYFSVQSLIRSFWKPNTLK